ncbi:MAG TPA: hypothetical protein VJN93_08730 [Candidatus Acidoferrum sp.]|nr:hypothetical protein [Candidatus Acidoferrum sp.]
MTSKKIKLAGSFFFAVVVGAILLCLLVSRKDLLAWLATSLGLAAGWGAGILFAPYQSEQERFKEYAKVISAFLSGYLVSKLDHLIELWFNVEYGPLVLRPNFAFRMMVGITAFLLAAVSTYVARKYLSFGPDAEQPPTAG